jgi:hypothetical protein
MCAIGDNGEKPPHVNLEWAHTVSQQKGKQIPNRNISQDLGSPKIIDDMEIENVEIPN